MGSCAWRNLGCWVKNKYSKIKISSFWQQRWSAVYLRFKSAFPKAMMIRSWRWSSCEEINALKKRPERDPLPLPPCEYTARCQNSATQNPSLEPDYADILTLDFHNCEEEISIAYKPPSLWYFVMVDFMDKDTYIQILNIELLL